MTDNDIIKALECCRDCKCKDCPCYNKETDGCKELDEQDILDLINRQNAELSKKDTEIDILIRKKEALRDENSELKAEVERWSKQPKKDLDEIIKTEAIKEFAERLKTEFEPETNYGVVANFTIKLFRNTIDNLEKEMTEGGGSDA